MHERHQEQNADAEADRQMRRRSRKIDERVMAIASNRISQHHRSETDTSNRACSSRERRETEFVANRKYKNRHQTGH